MAGSDGRSDGYTSNLNSPKAYPTLFAFALVLALIFMVIIMILAFKNLSLKSEIAELENKIEELEKNNIQHKEE